VLEPRLRSSPIPLSRLASRSWTCPLDISARLDREIRIGAVARHRGLRFIYVLTRGPTSTSGASWTAYKNKPATNASLIAERMSASGDHVAGPSAACRAIADALLHPLSMVLLRSLIGDVRSACRRTAAPPGG